jgi:hypothetical protein
VVEWQRETSYQVFQCLFAQEITTALLLHSSSEVSLHCRHGGHTATTDIHGFQGTLCMVALDCTVQHMCWTKASGHVCPKIPCL